MKNINLINCSLCGCEFEKTHNTIYIIWYGTQIIVCNKPCTFSDFLKSQ